MSARPYEVGQDVMVLSSRIRHGDRPVVGKVVKVGRKLVTVEWKRRPESNLPVTSGQFRIDTGRLNDGYGNTWLEDVEVYRQRAERDRLVTELRTHGVLFDSGRTPRVPVLVQLLDAFDAQEQS